MTYKSDRICSTSLVTQCSHQKCRPGCRGKALSAAGTRKKKLRRPGKCSSDFLVKKEVEEVLTTFFVGVFRMAPSQEVFFSPQSGLREGTVRVPGERQGVLMRTKTRESRLLGASRRSLCQWRPLANTELGNQIHRTLWLRKARFQPGCQALVVKDIFRWQTKCP